MAKFTASILAVMAISAAAFAPAPISTKTSSLNEFAKGMVGSEGPEPMPFNWGEKTSKNFDPVGFSEVSVDKMKHGWSIICLVDFSGCYVDRIVTPT
jgi:hypothetical protein